MICRSALGAVLLVGCVHASTVTYEDGRMLVECNRSMRDCKREAADDCPNGYEKLAESVEDDGAVATGIQTGNVIYVRSRPRIHGTLVIRCKAPKLKNPELP